MSSDRPYQSQLFTVLNRTVQRAKDQAGLLWRNLKVAVTWGAQLSLYPFYAVVKASQLAGKQLGQTWRSERFRLPAWITGDRDPLPTPDAPIQTILTALLGRQIAALPAGEADCLMIALAEGTQIQGVASILSTRRLAIVTTTNQTLDILSGPQQHELRQRIIYEMASYWRALRSQRLAPKASPILQGLRDRFSIARLSGFQFALAPIQIPTLWSDRAPVTHAAPAAHELSDLIKAALHYFFGGSIGQGQISPPRNANITPLPAATHTVAYPVATLNLYPVQPSVQLPAQPQIKPQPNPIASAIALDPWLLIPDAQPSRPVVTQTHPIARTIALPAAPALPSLTTVKNWVQSRLFANMHGTSLAPSATKPSTVGPITVRTAVRTTSASPTRASSVQPNAPSSTKTNLPTRATSTRVAHAPDWLETRATNLGYDLPWFDRLVLGLDRAIVFLEQVFLTFWGWLQVLRKTR